MRFFLPLSLILLSFLAFPGSAKADWVDDVVCWFLPCTGSGDEVFVRPNLEDGKTPHNVRWADDDWKPEDWVDEEHTAQDVMSGFYRAGIITDQDVRGPGNVSVEVGQGFMRLSNLEKRRVIRFVDWVGGYTSGAPNGVIVLYHKASGDSIGSYNAEGLYLQ